MHPVPLELIGRPFTTAEATAAGVSCDVLAGRRFERLHQGVYVTRGTELDLLTRVAAAQLVLPADAAASHVTALRLRGLEIGPERPLHFSTNRPVHRHRRGLVVHRRQDLLRPVLVGELPVLDPIRTFVDVATQLDDRRLLGVGDWLSRHAGLDPWELRSFVIMSHLDGVQRARRVAPLVTTGVDSVRESDVRWHLGRAGLPIPDVNREIVDEDGRWLARGDLVYARFKVLVEYDGWHHERDAAQRQWDHLRREQLEAAGWSVIVVTAEDLKRPSLVVQRVRQALTRRGWTA